MKTVTIIQPWTTLVALGVKTLETRSWATKHRGPLAIHAGQKVDKEACLIPKIREVLSKHGINDWSELPTGAVIAKSVLTDVFSISRPFHHTELSAVHLSSLDQNIQKMWGTPEMIGVRLPDEYHFGDYSDGRFAWQLDDVVQLQEPVPAKGQLSLWNWEETG
ncbi:hypothetical protein ABIE27_005058 [Paenibacillus sp. 4624]|uniref:ASCH domain-containing protein n=1 Tax=Paenibacillus sp. 4624 TaxID=3156453 RepID=UPI003D1BCC36